MPATLRRKRRSGSLSDWRRNGILPTTLVTSLVVGVSSGLMRPGYDEYYWLAIARKVSLGGTLYVDAIDNKTPFVYGLTRALDAAPGGYVLARSVMVALLVGAVVWLAYRLARLESSGLRSLVGVTAGLTLALQNRLVYTTELVAVVLLLSSALLATKRRGVAAVTVACAATLFDPRSLLMLPGVVALVWRNADLGARSRAIAVAVMLVAAEICIVLSVPNLRFALVEINVASRPSPTLNLFGLSLLTLLKDALPFLLLWYALRRQDIYPNLTVVGWIFLAGAMSIGVLSLQPIDHYWSYLVVVLPFAWTPTAVHESKYLPIRLLVACSLVPLVAMNIAAGARRAATESRYTSVAAAMSPMAGSYVALDDQPYLAAMLPRRNVLRSPTLRYLVWRSSREEQFRAELPELIGTANVLVEDGILETPSGDIPVPYRYLKKVALEEIPSFPCSQVVADTTLHYRCDTP